MHLSVYRFMLSSSICSLQCSCRSTRCRDLHTRHASQRLIQSMSRVRRATQLSMPMSIPKYVRLPRAPPLLPTSVIFYRVCSTVRLTKGSTIGKGEDRERGKQSKQNDFLFFVFIIALI